MTVGNSHAATVLEGKQAATAEVPGSEVRKAQTAEARSPAPIPPEVGNADDRRPLPPAVPLSTRFVRSLLKGVRSFLNGIRLLLKGVLSVLLLGAAVVAALVIWDYYITSPWTRDGRVRVQVASVAPQVSGQIVELRVVDNQYVRKGEVLYVIDPFDYRVAVDTANADVANRAADLQVKRAQAARREALSTVSTSIEEKQQFAGTAKIAEATYASAQSQLAQARINQDRTRVRSPVNGYVTNLLLRVGDYATKGAVNISLVDADSYWIDGYFEETKMSHIRLGAEAEAMLMGYSVPIRGRVESITRGISTGNASSGTQGLPNVDPVYTWVRLAQRVPVRIRIETVPPGVPLVAGMTATVTVRDPSTPRNETWPQAVATILSRRFSVPTSNTPAPSGPAVTTHVIGARTVSTLAVPEPALGAGRWHR